MPANSTPVLMQPGPGGQSLLQENKNLLQELEQAYLTMETLLTQQLREKDIAYQELQRKTLVLESLYNELNSKEKLLINLQRTSAVGQFVANIISELNTPLTIISGNAELAHLKTADPAMKQRMRIISENVKHIHSYLERCHSLYSSGREKFGLFDINEHLKKAMETFSILKPGDIRLELDIPDTPMMVNGDREQIMQIYLSLCKNAFEELQTRGDTLGVATAQLSVGELKDRIDDRYTFSQDGGEWLKILSRYSHFAAVTFSDNGRGIPGNIIYRIFEPYHSTKSEGPGMGLGLTICADIAARHHGTIAVTSETGTRTEFVLLLPLAENE